MRTVLCLFAFSVLLAACGKADESYPPAYQLNFMRACEAQNPIEGVCACTWGKIEAEVPRSAFDGLERLPAAERGASPVQRQIEEFARACASAP